MVSWRNMVDGLVLANIIREDSWLEALGHLFLMMELLGQRETTLPGLLNWQPKATLVL